MKRLTLHTNSDGRKLNLGSDKYLRGNDGKSAYEIWLEQGNEGTKAEFLERLKGEDYVLTEADKEEIAEMTAEKVQKPDIPEGMASEEWVNSNFQPKGSYATETQLENVEKKIPTKNSQLENDSNFAYKADIPSTLPASDVYDWAKQPNKPTYNKSDVGLSNVDNVKQYSASNPPPYPVTSVNGKTGAVTVDVPTTLSQLTEDSTHRVVTDEEKTAWNAKSNFSGSYNDLTNKPTKVSEFDNDAGYQTAEQVSNIVEEKLTADGIPTYWNTHLDKKIATIKTLQNEGGKDCFSFVFMTDIHYPSNLGKCSPALAKKIVDECNIKFVLNGGDNQTRGCYQTKDEILLENKQLKEMFSPIKDKVLQIEGNHDGSYYWSGGSLGNGTAYVKQLTEQEMFEEYYRANGLNGDVHFDENSNAFYVDDVSNKVRYIGLNSMNVPNSKDDVNADGTAKYIKFTSYQFLQAQYDFLCNEALATVPSDKWSVVVFGHSGIYNEGDYAVMVDVLSAYKDKTNCVSEYAGTAAGGAAYTNLAEPLPDNTTDTTKWVNGYRISSSGMPAQSGKTVSNPVNIKKGDVVRVKGVSFVAGADRVQIHSHTNDTMYYRAYISDLPDATLDYTLEGDVHTFTLISESSNYPECDIRFSFDTPTNPEDVIITVNEEIVEAEHGYDYVSVNHDFSNAKGKFVAYFHGHDHKDADYTRDSIKDISTRCDGVEEHTADLQAERVKDTTTEQSFDVFTVNKAEGKIYATKIGAGSDREISY